MSGNVKLDVPFTVSGGVAAVGEIPQSALNELASNPAVTAITIDLSTSGPVYSAVFPTAALSALSAAVNGTSNNIESVSVKMTDAALAMDGNVLTALAAQARAENLTMDAKAISASDLSAGQRAALGDRSVYGGVRLNMSANGSDITSLNGGRLTVSIPVSAPGGADFSAFYVNDERAARHATSYADGQASFRIAHFSDFVVASDTPVSYTDVDSSDWFADVVAYASRSSLMVGDGYGGFAPGATVTRAMLAQILYNLEGAAAEAAGAGFSDVAASAWYAKAVNWAASAGVIAGVGDNRFDPLADVTREQAAQMLYNYANYKNYSMSNSKTLGAFTDVSSVSSWAQDALRWAVGEKLISGKGNGILAPQTSATRAEIAKILTYFCESYEQ